MACPDPRGPVRKICFPIDSRMGRQRAMVCGSPPTMIDNVASAALRAPPETGASTRAIPCSPSSAPSSRVPTGDDELMSMTMLPLASRGSASPITARTAFPSGSMVMTAAQSANVPCGSAKVSPGRVRGPRRSSREERAGNPRDRHCAPWEDPSARARRTRRGREDGADRPSLPYLHYLLTEVLAPEHPDERARSVLETLRHRLPVADPLRGHVPRKLPERLRPDFQMLGDDEPLHEEPVHQDRPDVVERDVLAAISGDEAAESDPPE